MLVSEAVRLAHGGLRPPLGPRVRGAAAPLRPAQGASPGPLDPRREALLASASRAGQLRQWRFVTHGLAIFGSAGGSPAA